MESDLAAVSSFEAKALERLKELMREKERDLGKETAGTAQTATTSDTPAPKRVVKVRISEFFSQPVDSKEAVERSVKKLRDHLLMLLEKDVEIVLE